jgi:hypothetical protein
MALGRAREPRLQRPCPHTGHPGARDRRLVARMCASAAACGGVVQLARISRGGGAGHGQVPGALEYFTQTGLARGVTISQQLSLGPTR